MTHWFVGDANARDRNADQPWSNCGTTGRSSGRAHRSKGCLRWNGAPGPVEQPIDAAGEPAVLVGYVRFATFVSAVAHGQRSAPESEAGISQAATVARSGGRVRDDDASAGCRRARSGPARGEDHAWRAGDASGIVLGQYENPPGLSWPERTRQERPGQTRVRPVSDPSGADRQDRRAGNAGSGGSPART